MSWHNWFIIQDWMIILRMIKALFLLIYLAASLYHLSELIVTQVSGVHQHFQTTISLESDLSLLGFGESQPALLVLVT